MRPGRGRITMMRSASTIASSTSWVTMTSVGFESAHSVEQMILQVGAGERVERGERLVQQQHLRPRHQRARNGDALRLPAGQFARPYLRLVGQADARERSARRARSRSAFGQSFEAEADIVGDLQPRQQARLLEDDADLLVRRRDPLAVEHDAALASACRGREIARSSVDLPQPEPPITATISPGIDRRA